jgi:hypothetical protein
MVEHLARLAGAGPPVTRQPRPGPERSAVFVFGSNTEGRHGRGAARTARERFGAVYGQARGRQGASYAIVTKELRPHRPAVTLSDVETEVAAFLDYARRRPGEVFLVSRVGGGLAGFSWERDVRPLFSGAPGNVRLLEDEEV